MPDVGSATVASRDANTKLIGLNGAGAVRRFDGSLLVDGPAASVDGEMAFLSGTSGKLLRRGWRPVPTLESFREGVGLASAEADTEAFQMALAEGGEIQLLPHADYYLGEGGIATQRIALRGAHCSRLMLTGDFSASEDVLTIKPALGANLIGTSIKDIDIQCLVDGVGRHAIEIDHTAHEYVSSGMLTIERVTVGSPVDIDTVTTVSGNAIHYTPHPSDANGLFCSTIKDCVLMGQSGAIYMTKAGDSLNFERLKLYGPGRGMYLDMIAGAANLRIVGCNITTSGGAIHIKNGPLSRIDDCQIEMLSAWTGDGDADNRAILVFEDCTSAWVNNCNIHASLFSSDHAHCVSIKGSSTRIRLGASNRMVTTSPYEHIHSVSTQVPAVIAERIHWLEQPPSTIVANPVNAHVAGTAEGLWSAALTLANSWVASSFGGALYEGLFFKAMPDGSVRLRGSIAGGTYADATTIATLPAIARPSKITRINARVYNGTDYVPCSLAIQTNGVIQIVDALPTNTALSFDNVMFDRT